MNDLGAAATMFHQQEDLARSKNDFAGYPDRWELTEIYIKQIENALK